MSREEVIKSLSFSKLFAQCHKCGGGFKLSDALIFDGLISFPEQALKLQGEKEDEYIERSDALEKSTLQADEGAEKRAYSVGFGKIMEKIIPANKDFGIPLSECRPLFEPIDMIAFNGLEKENIESITFYEIKTGKSRLNKHERMIRDAVNDKRVSLREI